MAEILWSELTAWEIEEERKKGSRVIVPCGSVEQHGKHLPTGTDTFCVLEVAKRVAERYGGVVAPPLFFGLSYPHRGFPGVIELSLETYLGVVRDIASSLARGGWRKIVFLNGHYDNLYAIAYALAQVYPSLPAGTVAYTVSYWEGLSGESAALFTEDGQGLHAGFGETALCMAICGTLVRKDRMEAEFLTRPSFKTSVHVAYFLTHPSSLFRATVSGVWGNPLLATEEAGKNLLEELVESCGKLIIEIEEAFATLPKRH
ncbi:MAG: creatininase family protein [Candidatus Caldatribacterium sp.]|nr:creatininase family protein [Candidatus Caldatribacterium sp.]